MLLRRLIWTALAVALVVGSAQALLQQWLAVPLILAAEVFENAPAPTAPSAPAMAAVPLHGEPGHDHAIHHDPALFAGAATPAAHDNAAHEHKHDEEAWAPQDGAERTFWTWVASVLDTLALCLLALAAMTGSQMLTQQRQQTPLRALPLGLLVAAAGWLSLHLWPTLGLPAELPGMQAAELGARQSWWLLAVACAAAACALAGLARGHWRWLAAVALLTLPFLIGAPHVADALAEFGPQARAQMEALEQQFHTATHLLAITQWLGIGLIGGLLFGRWVQPVLRQPGSVAATPAAQGQ